MVIIKRDGRKILFYRTGEADWFLGVRVSSYDEFVKTHNRLHTNVWFSGDLEDQFLAICEDIKNAVIVLEDAGMIERDTVKAWAHCNVRIINKPMQKVDYTTGL